jgi:hypothetical protein
MSLFIAHISHIWSIPRLLPYSECIFNFFTNKTFHCLFLFQVEIVVLIIIASLAATFIECAGARAIAWYVVFLWLALRSLVGCAVMVWRLFDSLSNRLRICPLLTYSLGVNSLIPLGVRARRISSWAFWNVYFWPRLSRDRIIFRKSCNVSEGLELTPYVSE